MSTIFNTRCPLCQKEFRTRNAILRHYRQRHPGHDLPYFLSFFDGDKEVDVPQPKEIAPNKREEYVKWLTELVDGLNSVHHPKAPGKWYSFQLTNVPKPYFTHLLFKIKSAKVNSIRHIKHLKPPVWTDETICVSYKTTVADDVLEALEEQKVPIYQHKAFNGSMEIKDNKNTQLYGREALAAAKKPKSQRAIQPTLRSEINISEGEGRATRELELKWLPLYMNSKNGVLIVRIYVGKISL